MKPTRRILHLLVLLFALTSTSCAAWFQELRDDPITALQQGIQYLQSAEGLADTGFYVWAATQTDPAVVAQAQTEFNAIKSRIAQGFVVAQDLLRTAADAHQPAPDPNVLLADAKQALTDLNHFLAGLHTRGAASGAPMAVAMARSIPPELQRAIIATERAAHWHN